MNEGAIKIFGSEVLRQKAESVEEITPKIKKIIQEMAQVMKSAKGIGIAAPQLGYPLQIFIVDREALGLGKDPLIVLNPVITYIEGESISEEGCLSIPGLYYDVPRPFRVNLEYRDLGLETKNIQAEGLFSRVLLHEYDHLQGVLFIDRLPTITRRILLGKWRKKWKNLESLK